MTLAALGAMAAVAGVVDAFFPGALKGLQGLIWFALSLAVIWGIAIAWPRPVEISFEAPKTKIKVVRGDLFDQEAHLVIGSCDTFDTAFPFISPRSVQGIFLSKVFAGDVAALDRELASALEGIKTVDWIEKEGKKDRYEVGTVATIKSAARRYFMVAYTSMDPNNKASGTADGLWKSLGNLWEQARNDSNGFPLAIPIVGGGQSGLSPVLPAEDAIRFIALSFIIASRKSPICDELRIVALPDAYDNLDHLELQAFLKGLRRS